MQVQDNSDYMDGKGFRLGRTGQLLVILFVLASQVSQQALAFRLPEGGLALQRLLGEGQGAGRRYKLSYMPVLLELARLLGRYQAPPRMFFYIENESFANYPGIDLRSLLLKQSSPLKVPEGLDEPDSSMPSETPAQPVLSFPTLDPDASADGGKMNDGSVPQLAMRPLASDSDLTQPTQPQAQVASPDKIKLSVRGNELSPGPSLSFDFRSISKALGEPTSGLDSPLSDLPLLSSSFPTLIAFGEAVHNSTPFLFWTCHDGKGRAQNQEQLGGLKENSPFKGTFVACKQMTRISWIKNRHIGLQHGRMLAVNRGGDLGVDTPLGSVAIDPGAAAIVEYSDSKILKVMALESSSPGRVVVEIHHPDGTASSARLLQGEALLVAGRNISREELAGDNGVPLQNAQEKERVVHALYAVNDLLSKEILLDTSNPELTSEQRSALIQLRERLNARNMADQK